MNYGFIVLRAVIKKQRNIRANFVRIIRCNFFYKYVFEFNDNKVSILTITYI